MYYDHLRLSAVRLACSLTVSCRTVADTGSTVPAFQQLADNQDTHTPPSSCSSPQSLQRSRRGTSYCSAHSPHKIYKPLDLFKMRNFTKTVKNIYFASCFYKFIKNKSPILTWCCRKVYGIYTAAFLFWRIFWWTGWAHAVCRKQFVACYHRLQVQGCQLRSRRLRHFRRRCFLELLPACCVPLSFATPTRQIAPSAIEALRLAFAFTRSLNKFHQV